MNLHYLMNELYYQKRRTLTAILGLSIGIALLIILNALSVAYRQAAHAPLKEIGADITVQRPGDVPKDLTGVVFPCSAVTIQDDQVRKIQGLDGVRGIGKAVLLWIFDPNRAWIVLGVEQQNSIGPAVLRSAVTEGRFLEPGKPEALVEMSYARQFGIKVGDTISMAGASFPVVGLANAENRSDRVIGPHKVGERRNCENDPAVALPGSFLAREMNIVEAQVSDNGDVHIRTASWAPFPSNRVRSIATIADKGTGFHRGVFQ